jgi:hypothetical protein
MGYTARGCTSSRPVTKPRERARCSRGRGDQTAHPGALAAATVELILRLRKELADRGLDAGDLDRVLSAALASWRKPAAVHDPAKMLCDLAISLALGGDCLADVAVVRAEPGVYGRVASDPTVSRTVDALAADADQMRPWMWCTSFPLMCVAS